MSTVWHSAGASQETMTTVTPCIHNCGWTAFGRHRTCCTHCPHRHAKDCPVKNARVDSVVQPPSRGADALTVEPSLPMFAATLTERLRQKRRTGIRLRFSTTNYDHAVAFLTKRQMNLDHFADIITVFHGTRKTNFANIIDRNLCVPDGKNVLHVTDQGYYGKGIYTSPNVDTSLSYAHEGAVFVCLALPGRKFPARSTQHGQPCTPGYDSHVSPDGNEIVFFSSDQLLPCFLVGREDVTKALEAVADARDRILRFQKSPEVDVTE
eukprot:m.196564 g.196564  ORF g.196564 m.196564 type:complete len:266 (-) comp19856_c0_seq1:198-995(-)